MALGATAISPEAVAQDDEVMEEIVTTGIRGSLTRSMDVKRAATGVVDAISAEDIGKFPDQNLAESLQRITGVSIDRARGEGSSVTVRGFGPEYNLVTVNGRQMPTHRGDSRSFDFADLASEGVAGVEVYKTGRADVPSGGIGSSINIKTPKPLDGEATLSLAAKSVFDRSSRTGNEITPEFSGIYLDQFADDTVGIAIVASHQNRNSGENASIIDGWFIRPGNDILPDGTPSARLPTNADQVNRPTGANEFYSLPRNVEYRISEFETDRTNAQLVLQWAPTDSITATVDYIRAEFELERRYNDTGAWFYNVDAGSQASEWTDGPYATPITYTETNDLRANRDFAMSTGQDGSKNLNQSVGFNLEWWINDRFSLALDYHDSSAEQSPNSPFGTSANIAMSSFNRLGSTYIGGFELPIVSLDLNPFGDEDRPVYRDDMIITGSVFDNGAAKMDLEQAKISGSFEFFESSSIDFGVQTTEVSNRSVSSNTQLNNWGGISEPGFISDILVRSSLDGQFDEISGHDHPDLQTEFFTASMVDLTTRAEEVYAMTGREYGAVGDCGTGYCASTDWTTDKRTTEETTAYYLQYNWTGDLFNRPANLHVGVRHEETDVRSAALDATYGGSRWIGAVSELNIVRAEDADGNVIQSFTDVTGTYDVTLPNFDFDIEPWEDVVLRASFSETITRPNYNDIKGGLTPGGTQYTPLEPLGASAGNPGLVPIQSFNIDFSVEWYYSDSSYFSVGYFDKDVENFIGTGRELATTFEIPNIIGGALWNRALADSGINPQNYREVGEYILANYQDDPAVNGDTIVSVPGDPSIVFDLTRPVNEKTAKVDGWEVNLQHNFGDTPFGFVLNATTTNADVGYDATNPLEGQFILGGLSDSANLIAYYDTEDLQVRLAYNWRDDFIIAAGGGTGAGANPLYTEEYGQWDLNVTYYYNDNLTLYFSGLNLTNETRHLYGYSKDQVVQAIQNGPRYDFGLRYDFDF